MCVYIHNTYFGTTNDSRRSRLRIDVARHFSPSEIGKSLSKLWTARVLEMYYLNLHFDLLDSIFGFHIYPYLHFGLSASWPSFGMFSCVLSCWSCMSQTRLRASCQVDASSRQPWVRLVSCTHACDSMRLNATHGTDIFQLSLLRIS